MSFFDSIGKGIIGQLTGDREQNSLIGAAAHLITSDNVGGLSGLAQLFNKQGHGDTIASWISAGENRPISPQELQTVLGEDRLRQIANAAGLSEPDASRGLANVLLQLVDKLTPDSKLPESDKANDALAQLVSRFLRH
ncbi:MAG: DUF937 domain-containing protein [Gammaproteobacteria bacterium]|nr:DUF937 domain-containing protein [Gammaproteobacteria bacterium]